MRQNVSVQVSSLLVEVRRSLDFIAGWLRLRFLKGILRFMVRMRFRLNWRTIDICMKVAGWYSARTRRVKTDVRLDFLFKVGKHWVYRRDHLLNFAVELHAIRAYLTRFTVATFVHISSCEQSALFWELRITGFELSVEWTKTAAICHIGGQTNGNCVVDLLAEIPDEIF